jgi:1-acyl-sn-glycerol-3-phosphate acyltransferase
MKALLRGVSRVVFRVEAAGAEHVPPSGPALIVSNHSSLLDPPIVGAMSPRTMYFMAKAELFRIPLLGRLLYALNGRPVRRGESDASALRTALRVLANGEALLVFPEATRGPEGVLREGKPGAGMLAIVSGAPVVPAYVSGSGRAWPRGRILPRPVKVRVHFGQPLRFGGDAQGDRKAQYRAASQSMMAAIATLRDETNARRRNGRNG